MKITPDQLEKDLKAGKTAPVYLIHGAEVLLIDRALESLKAALAPDASDFSFEAHSAPETTPGAVSSGLAQMNVFGGDKVVMVKHLHEVKAEWWEGLLEVIDQPPSGSRLILSAQAKIAANTRLYKAVNKSGVVVELAPFRERDAGVWLERAARDKNRRLTAQAREMLLLRAGTSLADLAAELDKLDLYTPPGETITEDHVLEVAAQVKGYDNFALGEAVAGRDSMKALAIIHHLMSTGDPRGLGPALVGVLAAKIRTLLKARELIDDGREGQAAKSLRLPPFIARNYISQARSFNRDELAEALVRLSKTDIAIKTGTPVRESLETFVLWLGRGKGRQKS